MARFSRFSRKPRFSRKRRGNQGTWFPINGTVWNTEGSFFYDASSTYQIDSIQVDKGNGTSEIVDPITQDYSANAGTAGGLLIAEQPSLRDYVEGNDYILKRLVGNCLVVATGPNPQTPIFSPANQWTHVQVSAGFFVARAGDADVTLPDLTFDEIDSLNGANIQNPWIWRRTWILSNPANQFVYGTTPSLSTFAYSTYTNAAFAQGSDHHFDTKSRRRIRREERLWFSLNAIGWDGNRAVVLGQETEQPGLKVNLDIRLFGKMVKGKNASTF